MAITVTATQGGSTANGFLLRVFVLTGAKAAASQAGAAPNFSTASGTTFTVAGTITATSSFVYGAAVHGNQADTASGVTIVDDVADGTNFEEYCTWKQLAPSSGSQTLGTTIGSASSGGVAWLEVQASGTLAEDASAPAQVNTTGAGPLTTASFTPPAGSLLVALISSDGGAAVTTFTVSDTSGLTWTEKAKANASGDDYAGVWIADVTAAGGVTFVPQRYGQSAAPSPAPWEQRPYRSVPGTADTPANPLPSPLDTAWQASGGYWHLYGDTAARDRRAYFYQRALVSDPNLLTPAGPADPLQLNPEQSNSSDLWRVAAVPAFYDRREVPQQRAYYDISLLATALLENELLGGGDYSRQFLAATHYDRREVPQQPARLADPLLIGTAELENELLGGAQTWMHYVTADWYDRREIPQQRPYISPPGAVDTPANPLVSPLDTAWQADASYSHLYADSHLRDRRQYFYQRILASDPSLLTPPGPPDVTTSGWGAGAVYWHLYQRAADIGDRRAYFYQRLYQSDPLLLLSALLENELLGGAGTLMRYLVPATHADRREVPAQPPRLALQAPLVPLDPTQSAWAALWLAYNLAATHADRRLYPQQRLYFPVPLPPPPFTIGALTARDTALAVLTAASAAGGSGGTLTATDQRTGGPG